MAEIKTGLRIDMYGNVVAQSRRYIDAINKFSKSGRRDMKALGASTDRARGNIDRLGTRMTQLATGAGAAALIRTVAQSGRRLTRLGIAAEQSDESIQKLKDDIAEVASSPDIRVDASQIIGAQENILEMTGDFDFARDQIRNIGLALQATGADAQAVGGLFAEFQKAGIKSPEKVLEAIDTLNVQGKQGAFTLAEFARLGPRLFAAYAAVGRSGQLASREIGATVQVIRGATGSSEQATTSFEALLRVFSDMKKIRGLRRAGIQVFDVEELKQGREVLRPINEIMADIVRKTQGKATLIQKLVGDAEATRAFGNLIKEFNETGDVTSLQKFMQVMADGSTTLHDSQRAANDAAAAMSNLYNVLGNLADDTLTAPINFAADELNALLDDYKEFKDIAGQIVDNVSNFDFGEFFLPRRHQAPQQPAPALDNLGKGTASGPAEQRFEHKIKVEIDDKRATVKELKSSSPNAELQAQQFFRAGGHFGGAL